MHALDHKNVLKFFAWYETTNHLWLILEYCVGGDLLSLLRQDVRLPESSVHDFARDLVVSMQYLHSNSIIYCDLKPSNILLDENGRLKLGGFGLSRRLSDINKTPFTTLPQVDLCCRIGMHTREGWLR
jgi:serine/threonine-protein kinase ULK4